MAFEPTYPSGNSSLWNRNYILLVISNVLLYMAVYMLFPVLHHWMMEEWHCSDFYAGAVTAVFGISLFIPGAFNSYLVDTYKRKTVCMRSMLIFGAVGLAYPYIEQFQTVWLLRIMQGAAFGVALMSMGSTLAIDVTPSQRRNQANTFFTWASIVGMLLGLAAGYYVREEVAFPLLTQLSASLAAGAMLLVWLVKVPFRAPLELPLFSFDRFILFRSVPPGLNMMAVPIVLGMIFSTMYDSFFYLCMGVGFLCFLGSEVVMKKRMDGRMQVVAGQLLLAAGLLALFFFESGTYAYGAGFLVGFGSGFSLSQFLFVMIQLPLHCERGTGYHTYQLLWEAGVMLGVMFGKMNPLSWQYHPFGLAVVICLIGLVVYQTRIHAYYLRHMQNRKKQL